MLGKKYMYFDVSLINHPLVIVEILVTEDYNSYKNHSHITEQ